MKILKGIFYSLMALILLLCAAVLTCALTPSLTEMLAEKVENLGSAKAGGNGSQTEISPENSILKGLILGISGGQPEPQDGQDGWADEGTGGSPDGIREGNQTGYEPPDSQSIETPDSVSGRTGYEPVQEEAEQVPEEEGDELSEAASLGNTGSDLSFDAEFYPYYAMLEADMQKLYNQIYANAMEQALKFAPVVPVKVNQLKTVFEAVYNDHPELFWLETGYSCKYLRNGSCVEITLKYNATVDALDEAKQEFESRAGQVLQAANALGSALEKEQSVHDSLMGMVDYVLNAPMNQSAYSALVEGQTVCAGYARAFQYLCQQMGIPCYYCTGFAGEDHAWNIVKLGDDYYNVDVTWDDTDSPTYDYFNKTDQEFGKTHVRTGLSVYLPACVTEMEQPANPEVGAGEGAGSGDEGASEASGEGERDDISAYINPNPVEPLRWQGSTEEYPEESPAEEEETETENGTETGEDDTPTESGDSGEQADTGTEPGSEGTEAERQEALDRAGITEEDVLDSLQAYYEDCGNMLRTVGTGDCQFTNVIPSYLWSAVEQAYNNGDYRSGYVEGALDALDADSFVIHLQVQDLGGGYWRLYHNVYTY